MKLTFFSESGCKGKTFFSIFQIFLKDFFSDELQDNYNAIYRTREELHTFLDEAFLQKGFAIAEEGFLFDADILNNRKETAQYYYVIERK